jgi:hypothetical protein
MYLLNISVLKCICKIIVNGLNVSVMNPYLLTEHSVNHEISVKHICNISISATCSTARVHTHQQPHAMSPEFQDFSHMQHKFTPTNSHMQ